MALIKFKRTKTRDKQVNLEYGEPLANFGQNTLEVGGKDTLAGLTLVAAEAGGNGTLGLKYSLAYNDATGKKHAYWICNGFANNSYHSTSIKIADYINNIPVEEISAEAFKDSHLTNVAFPCKLRVIGSQAFYNCWISDVSIPKTIESIGQWAFGSDNEYYCNRFMLPKTFHRDLSAASDADIMHGDIKYRTMQCSITFAIGLVPFIGINPGAQHSDTTLIISSSPKSLDETTAYKPIIADDFPSDCSNITQLQFDHRLVNFGEGALQAFTALRKLSINSTYATFSADGSIRLEESAKNYFGTLFGHATDSAEPIRYLRQDKLANIQYANNGTIPYYTSSDFSKTDVSGIWFSPDYTLQCGTYEPIVNADEYSDAFKIKDTFAPLYIYVPESTSKQLILYGNYLERISDKEISSAITSGAFIPELKDGSLVISSDQNSESHLVGVSATDYTAQGLNSCCRIPAVKLNVSTNGQRYSFTLSPVFNEYLYRIPRTLTSIKLHDCTVGVRCFMNMDMLEEISFPAAINKIPDHCCYGCTSLRKTNLSDLSSLREISSAAFYSCHSLSEVVLPDNVETLGSHAFMNHQITANYNWLLPHIKQVENKWYLAKYCQPNNNFVGANEIDSNQENPSTWFQPKYTHSGGYLYRIDEGKHYYYSQSFFADNNYRNNFAEFRRWLDKQTIAKTIEANPSNINFGLKSITLNKNLQTIGYQAFAECAMLTRIEFPDSVNSVDSYAFQDCYSLEEIKLSENKSTASITFGTYCFTNCHSFKNLNIQSDRSVTFSANAFQRCYNLEEVRFNMTGTFYKNSNGFKEFLSDNPNQIFADANFVGTSDADKQSQHLDAAQCLSGYLITKSSDESADSSDVNYIFRNISDKNSNGKWRIYGNAFYQCPQLDVIMLGSGVEIRGAFLAENYSTSDSVWQPANKAYIPPTRACIYYGSGILSQSFAGCRNLRYIYAPNCESISDAAFRATPRLRYFYVGPKLSRIYYGAFSSDELYKTSSTEETLPIITNPIQLIFENYSKVTNPIAVQEFFVHASGNNRILTTDGKKRRGPIAIQLIYDHLAAASASDRKTKPRFINKAALIPTASGDTKTATVVTDVELTKTSKTQSAHNAVTSIYTTTSNSTDKTPLSNTSELDLKTWSLTPDFNGGTIGKGPWNSITECDFNRMKLLNIGVDTKSIPQMDYVSNVSLTVKKSDVVSSTFDFTDSSYGYGLLPDGESFVHWIFVYYVGLT